MTIPNPPSTTGPIRHRFLAVLDFLLRYSVQVYSVGVTPLSITVLLDERDDTSAASALVRAWAALTDADADPQASIRPHHGLDTAGGLVTIAGVLPDLGEIGFTTSVNGEVADLIAQAAGHEALPDGDTAIDLAALRVAAGLTGLAALARTDGAPADLDALLGRADQ